MSPSSGPVLASCRLSGSATSAKTKNASTHGDVEDTLYNGNCGAQHPAIQIAVEPVANCRKA